MDDPRRGTYILILNLPAPTRLTIGRLGVFDFADGWYAYAGSAFGGGGLRGRLKHHLAPVTRPHWHIDALRQAAQVCEVWSLADAANHEHAWAAALRSLPGSSIPAARFGASDCRCPAHLVYFPTAPDFAGFCAASGHPLQREVIV